MKTILKNITASAIMICMVLAMSASVFAADFTKEDAANKALKDAGYTRSEVKKLKAGKDGKEIEVEFKVRSTGDKYEYEFSASTGKIREKSADIAHSFNNSKAKVGKNAAIAAAAKAAGVKKSIVKKGSCRYKRDDGEWIYQIKFRKGKTGYEYEILAPTGKIIEYSIDY